jgi:hypothetical protein
MMTAEQLQQMAAAAQQDEAVKGVKSYVNLAEGKAVCVMESSARETVARWFERMGMPYDSIVQVELEGDRGDERSV